jgi:hypothetical protein
MLTLPSPARELVTLLARMSLVGKLSVDVDGLLFRVGVMDR